MRPNICISILLIVFAGFTACERITYSDELTVPLTTIKVTSKSDQGITVRGEIIEQQGREINTVFLNWYPSGTRHYTEQARYLMPVASNNGLVFTATIDRDVIKDEPYTYRFIYELDSNERLLSDKITDTISSEFPQPITEEFAIDRTLATTVDDFQIDEENFTLIADNTRYDYNGVNFLPRNDIPGGDINTQVLFLDSEDVNFFIRTAGKTLYIKRAQVAARVEVWQHIDGSQTVTRLGEILRPTSAQLIQDKIYFSTSDREIRVISSLDPFIQETVTDNPYADDFRVRAIHLTSSEEKLYILVRKNERVNPRLASASFLELYAYDVNTGTWEELPTPPGSPDGLLWISAEPGRLLFGGQIRGRDTENDLWVLDESLGREWAFIGWIPINSIISALPPKFSVGKHRLIGIKSDDSESAYYFSIDLNRLVRL